MKRLCLILFVLLLAAPAMAEEPLQLARMNPAVLGSGGGSTQTDPTGYLLVENFNITSSCTACNTSCSEDNSWTCTEGTNGILNLDDTTLAVLRGSQQFKSYSGDSGQYSNIYATFSASTETYSHFLFRADALPSAAVVFWGVASGTTAMTSLTLNSTGTISVTCGTSSATTTNAISADTDYRIWVHYKKGTGANAEYSVEFTPIATTIPSGSGNAYAGNTNGSRSDNADRVYLGSGVFFSSGRQMTLFFDQLYISSSVIGDVATYN